MKIILSYIQLHIDPGGSAHFAGLQAAVPQMLKQNKTDPLIQLTKSKSKTSFFYA